MRGKSVLLLMLALGCGLVASIGITQVMAKRNSSPQAPAAEMAAIFVAMEDIPMGDLVTAQMLKLEEWPEDKVPPGALGDIEDVEHRRPKSKIYAGSPILDDQLFGKGASEGGAAPRIPPGYRVVSVKVDDVSGTGRLIRPADRVDILVHLQRNPGKEILETCTRTILQDVKVFAVGDTFDLEATEGKNSITAKTISLLVTPGQAEVVMLATEMGKIRLSLRSHEDQELASVDGARPNELGRSRQPDRGNEGSAQAAPATNQSPDMDEFLKLLNSQGSQTAQTEESPEEPSNWTMRIIQGPEIDEVILESESDTSTSQTTASSFPFWKRIFSPRGADPEADSLAPDADQSGVEDEEEEEEEDEEEDDQQEDDELASYSRKAS